MCLFNYTMLYSLEYKQLRKNWCIFIVLFTVMKTTAQWSTLYFTQRLYSMLYSWHIPKQNAQIMLIAVSIVTCIANDSCNSLFHCKIFSCPKKARKIIFTNIIEQCNFFSRMLKMRALNKNCYMWKNFYVDIYQTREKQITVCRHLCTCLYIELQKELH